MSRTDICSIFPSIKSTTTSYFKSMYGPSGNLAPVIMSKIDVFSSINCAASSKLLDNNNKNVSLIIIN